MRYSDDIIEEVRTRNDIVDVVGSYVSLTPKGGSFWGCCPFHNEKTPSFVVSPSKGVFKCFGCGKAGNAVTFVMEHEGISYPEALKAVAKRYGIEVQERELTEEDIRRALTALDTGDYGAILRAKGIMPTVDGRWLHFDYVPQEHEVRFGAADYTGRLCVIGSQLKEDKLAALFGL